MRKIAIFLFIVLGTITYSKGQSRLLGKNPTPKSINNNLKEELDSVTIYNDKVLEGLWFMPDNADDNIYFHKGNIFEINQGDLYKSGSYKQTGDSVYLTSKDGWKLTLRHWTVWPDSKTLYLTKGDKKNWKFYLVKGSR